MFEDSLKRAEMRSGEVITAEVVRVEHSFVVVNAGLKSEAYVPIDEFKNDQGELEVQPGDFYALVPPTDDIHYVKTVSKASSISIHLLANDTACIWRHKFDPGLGTVTPFRSGYANAPCPPDESPA